MQNDPIWSDASVSIVAARCSWGLIEGTEGQYDWSYFDAVIAQAKACGKQCSLSVTFGTFTPDWVYAYTLPAANITMNSGAVVVMPWPWDPGYQQKISYFVQAMGQRYDQEPSVSYVAMSGMGRQMESFCVETPADVAIFDSIGGQLLWTQACSNIIGYYAQAFPTTPIIMPIGPPTPDQDGIDSLDSVVSSMESAYPGQFGIRSDGLRPNYNVNGPVAASLNEYNSGITGFQFSLPAQSESMSDYFTVAEPFNPSFIECFEGDLLNPVQLDSVTQASSWLTE